MNPLKTEGELACSRRVKLTINFRIWLRLRFMVLNATFRQLNAIDFNVINVDILMNFKFWITSVPNFHVLYWLFLYLKWCWKFEVNNKTASNVPGLRRISGQTIRNRLLGNGLPARRPYFGAVLRRRHRLSRVRWCNRVRGSHLQNWRRVRFSDVPKFMLQIWDGHTCAYRRQVPGCSGIEMLMCPCCATG
jgi:hypothetical protein